MKCDLLKKEVLFLGHIVGVNGIRPNPKLIDAVKKWVEPTTVKQVQQFLGLCNYYRRFVYQQIFSEIASPLTKLTEKKADFHWDQECQVAFDGLKEALCEAPVLAYPRSSGLFNVDTDASNTGVGGVLSQLQDDEEKVIWYASKKLSRAQRQYCVTRRELLAAVIFFTGIPTLYFGSRVHTQNRSQFFKVDFHLQVTTGTAITLTQSLITIQLQNNP